MALDPENWEKNTIFHQLPLLKKEPLAMIIDCGVNDFVITVSNLQFLLALRLSPFAFF